MSRRLVHLIRHAEAESRGSHGDAYRALAARGRLAMRKVAALLAAEEIPVDAIIASPLVRAVQTAEIIAGAVGVDFVAIEPIIAEPPSLEALVARIDASPGRALAVVGHEPTLSALAIHCLGAQARAHWSGFAAGHVLGLVRDPSTALWAHAFQLHPNGPRRIAALGPERTE